MGKYVKYAIGEILLVVIGILIALQINNWNEERKNAKVEIEVLTGIKKDLEYDFKFLDTLKTAIMKKLSYYNFVDPTFNLHEEDLVALQDSSTVLNYNKLMRRPRSFRTNNSSYQSFIAYGSANIIQNKTLLINLQKYYGSSVQGSLSMYDDIKKVQSNLNWNRAFEKKYKPYKTIESLNDEQFLAELDYYFDTIHAYLASLFTLGDEAGQLIKDIDNELNDLK